MNYNSLKIINVLIATFSLIYTSNAIADSPHEIVILQKENSDLSSKIQRTTIEKSATYLQGTSVKIDSEFTVNQNNYVFRLVSVGSGSDCINHKDIGKSLNAILIMGAISSNCTSALLSDSRFSDIPILNSFSTKDKINSKVTVSGEGEQYQHNRFFRTVFSDEKRVSEFVTALEKQNKNGDLRLFKLTVVYDEESKFSKGLKENIDNALEEEVDSGNISYVRLTDDIGECQNIEYDIDAIVFTTSKKKKALKVYESLMKCHLGRSKLSYYGFGNLDNFPFFTNNSFIITIPTLALYEEASLTASEILSDDRSVTLSLPTFMAVETLFNALENINSKNSGDIKVSRNKLNNMLKSTNQITSKITNKIFSFDSFGDINSDIIRAALYEGITSYGLTNQAIEVTTEVGVRITNKNIGLFDGMVNVEIFPTESLNGKEVNIYVSRITDEEERFPEHKTASFFPDISKLLDNREASVVLSSEDFTEYGFFPLSTGDYEIIIKQDGDKVLKKKKIISVGLPMNLFLALFVSLITTIISFKSTHIDDLKSTENMSDSRSSQTLLSNIIAAIIASFFLYLITVTLRNSGLPNLMPFISFSENHTVNAIMVGILAGAFGLNGIREFFVRLAQKFQFKPNR